MASQICETCKWKDARCYCAPNSTCEGYEPESSDVNMMQVKFDYPLPNNGDRYDLSKEELVELFKKAYDNGRQSIPEYSTISNATGCPKCGADLWCIWSETTLLNGPGNKITHHCNHCGHSWESVNAYGRVL